MKREINLIFGKTGTGKSTFAKRYIENYNRVVIIDAMEEYEGIIFYRMSDLFDYIEFNDLIDNDKPFRLVCRFSEDIEIEYLFETLFVVGNLLLVVEEAEIYISPYAKSGAFLKLVRYGRHKKISILGIARRSSELSLTFRSQVNCIYSFKQTDFNDLKYFEKLGLYGLDKLEDYKYPDKMIENVHYKKVCW